MPRRAAAIPASSMSPDRTCCLMPDRSGNNRIDSFRNIVEGSGFVQLIFFVPGIDETLRVGGKGKVSADPELMASMVEFGKPPRAVLRIDVREAYFHCGKALMRSKLWAGDAGRTLGDAEHRRGDPRPDRPRRARKPGRDLRALQDAAVGAAVMPGLVAGHPRLASRVQSKTSLGWPGSSPAMTRWMTVACSQLSPRSPARRHASGCRARARCA